MCPTFPAAADERGAALTKTAPVPSAVSSTSTSRSTSRTSSANCGGRGQQCAVGSHDHGSPVEDQLVLAADLVHVDDGAARLGHPAPPARPGAPGAGPASKGEALRLTRRLAPAAACSAMGPPGNHMSSQIDVPTGTPATTNRPGRALAGDEPALLVEDPVVREQALEIATEHATPGADGGGVDEVAGTVGVHVADDRRTRSTGGGDPVEDGQVVSHEGRTAQQVLGRIAGDGQLGEDGQVGPPDSASARAARMRSAFPSRSPTTVLIWHAATRTRRSIVPAYRACCLAFSPLPRRSVLRSREPTRLFILRSQLGNGAEMAPWDSDLALRAPRRRVLVRTAGHGRATLPAPPLWDRRGKEIGGGAQDHRKRNGPAVGRPACVACQSRRTAGEVEPSSSAPEGALQ